MKKAKFILKVLSLALFLLPPAALIYVQSSHASVFAKINISGCLFLIVGILIANRFLLANTTEKWRVMVAGWTADLKVAPDDAARKRLRYQIGKYENILLAFKVPLPAAIIAGLLVFLNALERAAANLSSALGVCSLFWLGGTALLFWANKVGARRVK